MPNDVKAIVSLVTLIVALVLAYWSGSPIRHDYATFVVVTAVLMIAAMWVSVNAASRLEPRWPLVPKTTCCAGSSGSGTSR